MKLNKFKVRLTLSVLLSVLLLSSVVFAVEQDGDNWIIEDQNDFNKLVGDKISEVDFDGDSVPDIDDGDTIALDSASFTQTASITIDRQNITIEPTKDVVNSDNVTTLKQISTYGGARTIDVGSDPGDTDDVTSSIVVTKEGAHVRNLNFEPEDSVTPNPVNNAILVDIQDPCACETRGMLFENLQIPTCGANGNFNYGIRFTGVIESYGDRSTDYSDVQFMDVRVDGVLKDGVNFADSVGDVSDLHFEKFYSGSCGSSCTGGYGLYFNNHGKVENITMEDSDNLGAEQQSRYGIEKSQDGIRVNGDSVTKVSGFRIEDFEIKNNCDNGIYLKGNWENDDEAITLVDLTVKDTEISENGDVLGDSEQEGLFDGGFGILIGDLVFGDGDYPEVTEIHYSPAKLDKITLDNVQVFNNASGGAGLFASKVAGPEDGVEVKDSRFNQEVTGNGENEQGFGLVVAGYEGIDGLEISNSEFHDHNGGLSGVELTGLPVQNLSDGIALLAAYQDGAHDDVEDVLIRNTEANNNDTSNDNGNGLRVEGKTVDGIDITKVSKFNDNGKNGIKLFGEEGVNDVTIEDGDEDEVREITANGNGNIGLLVESDRGNITDLSVTDAEFGKEGHKNKDNGVKVVTNEEDGDIGSSNSDGAVSFNNIAASYNLEHGMEINSAGDFLNPSQNVVVSDSEFYYNHKNGVNLAASGDVMNPRFENSSFVGNNVDSTNSAGLYIEFGGDLQGSANVSEISGNVLAGNEEGLTVKPPKPNTPPTGSISNFSVKDNTTYYDGNEEVYNGNVYRNFGLIAGQLNSIEVTENIVVGEETEIGLLLQAEDSSSAISVTKNIFRTGAEGACIGLGTAIVLDAWNSDINHNEIDGYSTGIEVRKEKPISSEDSASDTSNHINENNIVGCCTTIDASELENKSDDSNLYKVDATENYWGPDVQTAEDVAINIISPEHVFYGNVLDSPVVVIEILQINEFKSVTSEPEVGKTVELQFKLKNISESKISGQTVRMIVKNPDGDVIINTEKENVPELDSGKVYTNTHSFLPTQNGEYTATLEVDRGAVTKSIMIDVSGGEPGPGPEPDDYTPDWGKTGILPPPVGGDSTPYLEITDDGGNVRDGSGDVEQATIRVYDLSGKRLLNLENLNSVDDLSSINDLQNGLYLYTVELENPAGETKQSPVMKFVVKK